MGARVEMLVITITGLMLAAGMATTMEEAVRCREIDFALSVARSDAAAFASYLHPEVRYRNGDQPASGRDGFVAMWAPFFTDEGPRIAWRPESVVLLPDGDHAVSRGPYRVRTVRDGQPVERWGEFMSIWRRGEQGWQVVYDVAARTDLVPSDAQRALLDEGACASE